MLRHESVLPLLWKAFHFRSNSIFQNQSIYRHPDIQNLVICNDNKKSFILNEYFISKNFVHHVDLLHFSQKMFWIRDFPSHCFLSVFGINVKRDVHLTKERNLNQHLMDHWEFLDEFQMFGHWCTNACTIENCSRCLQFHALLHNRGHKAISTKKDHT